MIVYFVFFFFFHYVVAISVTNRELRSPEAVPRSFDCAARRLAHEFAKNLIPQQGEFVQVFDALQLADYCGDTRPPQLPPRVLPMPAAPPRSNTSMEVFVSPNGSDTNGQGSSYD